MRAKRKSTLANVWFNESGKEPMPPWVKSVAERSAKAGTSFLILQPDKERMLLPAGHYVIQGVNHVYPCDPESFKAGYEIINVAGPVQPDLGEKK